MQNLQTLISLLTKSRKIHISILDVSGVLTSEATKISFDNVIHSKDFCKIAKSSERGARLCLYCKMLANNKAIEEKVSFCGNCIYGLSEAAVPVISYGTVMAVVYVGNAVTDREISISRIEKSCRHSGVDPKQLKKELANCEENTSFDELLSIGDVVSDYLKSLIEKAPEKTKKHSWLVDAIKLHAEKTYTENPTLSELSILYHKNKKYLGRLFKSEIGKDFSEYCLELRLSKAERLLRETDEKIIDLALDSGFNNISYFNRVFKEKFKMSPKEWRMRRCSL